MARVLITYDHCSPAQVAVLTCAVTRLANAGHQLIPLEFLGALPGYGWTLKDAVRPADWRCLYPDRGHVRRTTIAVALARLVRRERFDAVVINGWFEPVSWIMGASRSYHAARLIMVTDSTEADRPRIYPVEQAKRILLGRMDAIFTAGTPQVRYLAKLGVDRSRTSIGCDVVDNQRFAAAASERPVRGPGDPVVIGTTARLVPVKNLDGALSALSGVVRDADRSRVSWRIAGRGPLEHQLKRRARELGAPVSFEGFVPYAGMPRFYAGLDLYWQPSRSEPWGLAVNEAMAAGLPVLVSERCGCAADLVSKENGWVHGLSLEDTQRALSAALGAQASWATMGARSSACIQAWGPDRFAAGLLSAVRIALDGECSGLPRQSFGGDEDTLS